MSEDKHKHVPEGPHQGQGLDPTIVKLSSDFLTAEEAKEMRDQERESDLQRDLDAFGSWIERCQAWKADPDASEDDFPGLSYDPQAFQELLDKVRSDNIKLASIGRFVEYSILARQVSRRPGTPVINDLAYNLGGPGLIGEAFAHEDEDGIVHRTLLNELESFAATGERVPETHVKILQHSLDGQPMAQFLQPSDDEFAVQLRTVLLTEKAIEALLKVEVRDIYSPEADEWLENALTSAVGIDKEEARNYLYFDKATRSHGPKSLADTIARFETLGVEALRQVSKVFGVYALNEYTTEQLHSMHRIAVGDTAEIERLAHHDVTLVMINRFGDTGASKGLTEKLDDERGRTVFSEITSFADMYRKLITLKKLGVIPSTLVLAAHGSTGEVTVQDLRGSQTRGKGDFVATWDKSGADYYNAHRPDDTFDAYSTDDTHGLNRIISEMMRPSLAVDDPDDALGRKKLVLIACKAAQDGDVVSYGSGEREVIGSASLAGTLAKEILAHDPSARIDIFGAGESVQARKSELGISFTKLRGTITDIDDMRELTESVRVRVEDGTTRVDIINEIPLHRAS